MSALNIRDIGDDRKASLEAEAQAMGLPVAELVRRMIDDGLRAMHAARAQKEWLAEAQGALANESEQLARHGPTLSRYRTVPTGDRDG